MKIFCDGTHYPRANEVSLVGGLIEASASMKGDKSYMAKTLFEEITP